MEYLLFVAYLVLFAWLVTKVKFFTRSGLNQSQLIIIFLLKVMAGIFYGWIGIYYGTLAKMVDTWSFHYGSIQEYRLLLNSPHEYFTNLFYTPYEGGFLKFFDTNDSYWNDLKGNFFIKILSVFNIFSFGHYYVNVVFYSFLTMFGPIAIFRVMNDIFPGKKLQVLLATFLVPSFVYWTSGIHKDGLIFVGLALIIYNIYFGLKEKKINWRRILYVLLGLLIILALRNFLIVIIIPAVLAWVLAERFSKHALAVFAGVYLLFAIIFFTAKYIHPRFDFPDAVVVKQKEFLQLKGGSAVPIKTLNPTIGSFLLNAPQAINLSVIRPYPSDVKHILSLAAAIEINFLLFLFIVFLFFRTNGIRSMTFIYFCIFFSLSLLLTIGYTVNFLGAIVRYRSLAIPFLIIPMICQMDWNRINQLLFSNIRNKNNIVNT
ncbi:MAG: hypothetical protein M3O67_03435 [Bacteroidota bacterium]|nr:hypothetical protein [Bacteroidota bacterium]